MLQFVPKKNSVRQVHTAHPVLEYTGESTYILDDNTNYKGTYNHKYDFVMIYLMTSIGLENLDGFSKSVYLNGGGAYLVFYVFLSFLFSIPIFLIECGLAQFYSMTDSRVYSVVPYFRGFGWCVLLLSIIRTIPYSIKIEWLIHSLFGAFTFRIAPWARCYIKVSAYNCVEIVNVTMRNLTKTELLPSNMFVEIVVKGSRNAIDGSLYHLSNSMQGFRIYQLVFIIVAWVIISVIVSVMARVFVKFIYLLLGLSFVTLLILTIHSLFRQGALNGISMFLSPNMGKFLTAASLKASLSQIMMSYCITKGLLSYASLNPFKYDFLRAIMIVILCDFTFCLVSGIFVFAVIGFLSDSMHIPVDSLVKNKILFINFFDASSLNNEYRVWAILYLLMLFTLSVCSIGIICGSFIICFIDYFPRLANRSQIKKFLLGIFLCIILCAFSLIFSLNGSCLLLEPLINHINYSCNPVMMLVEVLVINLIYGEKRLRIEIRMMFGYSYNIFWGILSLSLVPLSIIFVIIYTQYYETQKDAPSWVSIPINMLTFVIMLPLLISFPIQLIWNFHSDRKLKLLKVGFITPPHYGPYYKVNWALSKMYQKKLLKLKDDPKFLKTIRDTEDYNDVINHLRKSRADFKKKEKKFTLKKATNSSKI